MRVLALVLGLGLAVSLAAAVGTNDWVELTYEEPCCWVLDLPGVDGGRELYELSWPAPVDGVSRAYMDCRVLEQDEDALTITLGCPGSEEVVLGFECLLEWLAGGEESSEYAVVQEKEAEAVSTPNCCACDGKCSVCCPEGFIVRCYCVGSGTCECTAVEAPDDWDGS